MRLWTLHPKYLDAKGLVALWREALLAQKVLQGKTKGYRHHPQLIRFRGHARPVTAMAAYLKAVHDEATRRGYQFDRSKIARHSGAIELEETNGQLLYEWEHLRRKLKRRSPAIFAAHKGVTKPNVHPIFTVVRGPRREWEVVGRRSKNELETHYLVSYKRVKPASSTKRRAAKASARRRRISLRRKSAK